MKKISNMLFIGVVVVAGSVHAESSMKGESAPPIPGIDELKGTPTLVDFWASWCGPCQDSFPWMNEMKGKYPNLRIVAVNLDEYREDAQTFLDDNVANFQVVFDPEGQLAEKYKVDGMPSSYLIDENGNIVEHHVGFYAEEKSNYEEDIEALLSVESVDD